MTGKKKKFSMTTNKQTNDKNKILTASLVQLSQGKKKNSFWRPISKQMTQKKKYLPQTLFQLSFSTFIAIKIIIQHYS